MAALRSPSGPFPFLILQGPPASGKTFAARVLRALVDPSASPLTPVPPTVPDLLAVARQNWVLAFDHISTLAPRIPDALCRLSTGCGSALRETQRFEPEPLLQYYRRPVLLTATSRWSPPPELAERALILHLPSIPPANRRPESELLDALGQSLPAILGSLCSAVSTALRRLPGLDHVSGRLPDALAWILAAFPALACPGEECFTGNEIREAFAAPVAHTVEEAIRTLLGRQPHWSGTASQLFELLSPLASCCSPKALAEQLRGCATAFAAGGIAVKFRRSHGVRFIELSREPGAAPCEIPLSKPAAPAQVDEKTDLLAA